MKAFKTRIYPNAEQTVLIEKTFGCCRFVYNNGLECKIDAYKKDKTSLSAYDLIKRITILKKEFEWLKEPENIALQQSILDLEKAYKNFFREHRGFPKFKKKGDKDSFRTFRTHFVSRHFIYLPKIGTEKTKKR